MKKTLLLTALCLLQLALMAQPTMKGSSVDFTVGSGWTDMTYLVDQGKTVGNWGGYVHVGYNWFFSRYFGLGAGVDLTRNGGGLKLDREFVWSKVMDTNGEAYNHHAIVKDWREYQSAYYFEIPLSVQVAVPFEKVSFAAAWGVKYSVALGDGFYRGHGNVVHVGDYADGRMGMRYFYSDDLRFRDKLEVNNHWSMFLNVGVMVPLENNFFFVAQAYTNASIRPIVNCGGEMAGFRYDRDQLPYDFYFMPYYKSLLNTDVTRGITSSDAGMEGSEGITSGISTSSAYGFQIGLQLGFRYVFPARERKMK